MTIRLICAEGLLEFEGHLYETLDLAVSREGEWALDEMVRLPDDPDGAAVFEERAA